MTFLMVVVHLKEGGKAMPQKAGKRTGDVCEGSLGCYRMGYFGHITNDDDHIIELRLSAKSGRLISGLALVLWTGS